MERFRLDQALSKVKFHRRLRDWFLHGDDRITAPCAGVSRT